MEKKVYELKIDPDLRDLIPPLSEEEYNMLEDSIVRDGCDTPLIVWNGVIVDGHNRYEICRKHNVPFACDEKEFADKDTAMFWMLEHQLARRNLNSYQRSELALKFEPMLKREAKKRSMAGKPLDPPQNSAGGSSTGETREKIARIAGVSRDTIAKVKKIDANADDETKQQLRIGKKSIHMAYTDLMNKEHEGETRVCECCGKEKPFSEFRIASKSTEYRTICKDCEDNAKKAAKEAEKAASLPGPASVTGIGIRDGQTAHISTGLPDDPAMFDHVVDLLRHSQNAYLASFEATLNQYRPSMVTPEHNDLIRQMIDYIADTTEELLDKHIEEVK